MKRDARRETVSRTPERRRRVRASVWKKKRSSRVRELSSPRVPRRRALARSLTPPSPRGRLARRWTRDEVRRVSRFRARVPPPRSTPDTRRGRRPRPPPRDHLVFPDATSDGRAIHQRGVAGLHHRAARPISRGENEFSVGFSPGDVREGGRGGDVGGEASAGVDVEDEGVRSSSRAHATDDGARARDVSRRRRRGREHARARAVSRGNVAISRRFTSPATVRIANTSSRASSSSARASNGFPSSSSSSSSSSARRISAAVCAPRPALPNATVAFDAASTSSSARHSLVSSAAGAGVSIAAANDVSSSPDRVAVTNGAHQSGGDGPRATRRGFGRADPSTETFEMRYRRTSPSTEEAVHARNENENEPAADASLVAAASITNGRGVSSPSGSDGSSKRTPPGIEVHVEPSDPIARPTARSPSPREATSATGEVGDSAVGGTRNAATDGPREGRSRARRARARGAGARGKRGCQSRDAGSGVEVVGDVDGGESARGVREGETRPVRVGEGVELDEHISVARRRAGRRGPRTRTRGRRARGDRSRSSRTRRREVNPSRGGTPRRRRPGRVVAGTGLVVSSGGRVGTPRGKSSPRVARGGRGRSRVARRARTSKERSTRVDPKSDAMGVRGRAPDAARL